MIHVVRLSLIAWAVYAACFGALLFAVALFLAACVVRAPA